MDDENVDLDWSEAPKSQKTKTSKRKFRGRKATEAEDSAADEANGEQKSGLSEGVRRAIATGISSAFVSEEGIRSYLSELKLPTDVLSQVLKGAKKSRDEVIGKAGNELVKLVRKLDLSAEIRRLLVENKIKISAEIDFVPKSAEEVASEENSGAEKGDLSQGKDSNQIEFFES